MQKIINKISIVSIMALSLFLFASSVFAAGPSMLTIPASSVTATSATLNGTYSAVSGGVQVRFEYGTTSLLGSSTAYQTFSTTSGSFSASLAGLTPNTTYWFRSMGVDSTGPGFGSPTLTFTTPGYALATVLNTPASSITSSSATLNGAFTAGTSGMQTYFEYATNSSFVGSTVTNTTTQSSTSGSLNASIANLIPGTLYYFRLVAITNGGTTYGAPALSFTTSASYTPSTPTTSCSISYFNNSTPSAIVVGNSSLLSWDTSNCTSASITPVVGPAALSNAGYSVYPSSTTTYTLTAYGSNGAAVSATTTVNVTTNNQGGGNPTGQYCTISAYASQQNITSGQSTLLTWNATAGTTVYISNLGSYGSTGSQYVYPTYTTTYTFTVSDYNCTQSNSYPVTVTVNQNNTYYPTYPTYPSSPVYQTYPTGYTYPVQQSVVNPVYYPSTNTAVSVPSTQSRTVYQTVYVKKPASSSTVASATTSAVVQSQYDQNTNAYQYSLGASAAGSGGFLPQTLIGWLFVIIIILILVLVGRAISNRSTTPRQPTH